MRFVLFLSLLATPALADTPTEFFGVWGTATQCARAPIIEGGTRLAEPTELSKQWLKQGDLWCLLSWGPVEQRGTTQFTIANALCGEDSARSYFVGMTLADEKLTFRWGFLAPVTEPKARCEKY